MDSDQNINLKTLKCGCLFLILLGLCLYFKRISLPAGAVRSYFLLGFTFLFLIFGISFSDYRYTTYKKYFSDFVLKFIIYAAVYLIFSAAVISIEVFSVKNNLKLSTNIVAVINKTIFLFTNFWFIPTGLILLLCMPLLNKILKKINYSPVLFMAIVLALVVDEVVAPIIPNNALSLRDVFASLRYILFYGLFALIGLSYKTLFDTLKKNKAIIFLFIFSCLIVIAACLIIYGYSYNLIEHFYPPTFFLTVYHLLILSLVYLLLSKLKRPSSFLSDKKFVKFGSDYFLEIIIIMPVFLYLISLLFNIPIIASFFNKYYMVGFLTYFLCSILILILLYSIVNLIKIQQTKKKALN